MSSELTSKPESSGKTGLAIFAQMMPGTSAFVIGDTGSLQALRNAIDAALEGSVGTSHVEGVEGRPFTIVVSHQSGLPGDLAVPYTDPAYTERDDTRINPWQIPQIVSALSKR